MCRRVNAKKEKGCIYYEKDHEESNCIICSMRAVSGGPGRLRRKERRKLFSGDTAVRSAQRSKHNAGSRRGLRGRSGVKDKPDIGDKPVFCGKSDAGEQPVFRSCSGIKNQHCAFWELHKTSAGAFGLRPMLFMSEYKENPLYLRECVII